MYATSRKNVEMVLCTLCNGHIALGIGVLFLESIITTFMTLDGGWSALEYNGIPLTVDDDAIDGEMYFLTTKDIQKYRMSDYDWMDKDGSILARISGYDAYEAILFLYQELGCSRRNSHGVICDLSYTD